MAGSSGTSSATPTKGHLLWETTAVGRDTRMPSRRIGPRCTYIQRRCGVWLVRGARPQSAASSRASSNLHYQTVQGLQSPLRRATYDTRASNHRNNPHLAALHGRSNLPRIHPSPLTSDDPKSVFTSATASPNDLETAARDPSSPSIKLFLAPVAHCLLNPPTTRHSDHCRLAPCQLLHISRSRNQPLS